MDRSEQFLQDMGRMGHLEECLAEVTNDGLIPLENLQPGELRSAIRRAMPIEVSKEHLEGISDQDLRQAVDSQVKFGKEFTQEDEITLLRAYIEHANKSEHELDRQINIFGFKEYLEKHVSEDVRMRCREKAPDMIARYMQNNLTEFVQKNGGKDFQNWLVNTLKNKNEATNEIGGEAPASTYAAAVRALDHVNQLEYQVFYDRGEDKDPTRIVFSLKATSSTDMESFREIDATNEQSLGIIGGVDLAKVENESAQTKDEPASEVAASSASEPAREMNTRGEMQIGGILGRLGYQDEILRGRKHQPISIGIEKRDVFKEVIYMLRNTRGKQQIKETDQTRGQTQDIGKSI